MGRWTCVLVSLGCYNSLPWKIGVFYSRIYFLIVLEPLKVQDLKALEELVLGKDFLTFRQLPPLCCLMVFPLCPGIPGIFLCL